MPHRGQHSVGMFVSLLQQTCTQDERAGACLAVLNSECAFRSDGGIHVNTAKELPGPWSRQYTSSHNLKAAGFKECLLTEEFWEM